MPEETPPTPNETTHPQPIGEIIDGRTTLIAFWTETGKIASPSSGHPLLYVGHQMNGQPVIQCLETRKYFTIDWLTLSRLAEQAGIFKPYPEPTSPAEPPPETL